MPQPLENWAERVCAGDVLAVSRAITAIENHHAEAEELLRKVFPTHGQGVSDRNHGRAGDGQEHAGRSAGGALSASK